MKRRFVWNAAGRNYRWMAAALPGFLSGAVQAATVVWQEPVSGSFNNAQRWLVANVFPEQRRVPTAGDDIQIITGPAITVDVPGGATVANADIGETVTLNLSGTLAVTGTLDGAPIIGGAGKITAAQWNVGAPTPSIVGASAEVGSFKLTGNNFGLVLESGGTLKAGAYNGPNVHGSAPLQVDGENSNFTLTGSLDELAAPGLELTVRHGATATLGAVNRAGAFFLETGGRLTAGFFQPRHVEVHDGSILTTGEAKPLGFGPVSGFGPAEVVGGTWNIGGKLTLAGSTLRVSNGGHLQAQSFELTDFGRFELGNSPFPAGGGQPALRDGVFNITGSCVKNTGTLSLLGGELTCDSLTLTGEGAMQGESGLIAAPGRIDVQGAAVFDTNGSLKGTTVDAQSAVLGTIAGRRGQLTLETCAFRMRESLVIGQAGNGSVLAKESFVDPVNARSIVLGAAATGSGSLEVSTINAKAHVWELKDTLVVGDAGEGTLTIRQSLVDIIEATKVTIAKQPSSRGTVRVIGNKSVLNILSSSPADLPLVVGEGGQGMLSIEGGSVSLRDCSIGKSGADNFCQVSGPVPQPANSASKNLNASGNLVVGDGGRGTLTLDTGAHVSAGTFIAGRQSTADNRVTVASGCELSGRKSVVIGDSGTGRLDVTGRVDGGRLIIARGDGGKGTVNVTGPLASLFFFQGIELGGKPQARATLSLLAGVTETAELLAPVPPAGQADISLNGADTELSIASRMRLGRIGQASGPVTCNLSGGAFMSVGKELLVRKNSRVAVTGAAVLVGPGDPPPNGTVLLRTGGRLTGDGTVAARVEVSNGGRLAAGAALGTLTIEGDVVARPGSTLEFEISASTAPTGHDLLHATGAVNVQGAVELKFINGYAPKAGDRYCFITADGGLTFAPSSINVSGLAAGFAWTLSSDANNFCITASNAGQPDTTPALTIEHNSGDTLSLNWSADNWRIESAEDLNGNWQPVPPPPAGEGSYSLDITPGGGANFWRLKK
ncbi:MAG TPA: hypothetical protein VG796_27830 [Verrucomicrobiales bacterium]|nr:hypothetical protein [Verrucomicrobiales bacterium]